MLKQLYRKIKAWLLPEKVGAFAPDKQETTEPKLLRKVDEIIVHCTASDYAHHDNVKSVYQWHVLEKRWRAIGYHYLITKDGMIHNTRNIEWIGAHCYGRNAHSIGICLTGHEKFSDAQFKSLRRLVRELCDAHSIDPTAVYPHSKFANKTCPNFPLKEVLA